MAGLPPGEITGPYSIGGWVGLPRRVRKISPYRAYIVLPFLPFFLSIFLSIVYLYILCPHVTYSSTTHNTNIHAPAGFEPATPASKRPQILPLDFSAIGISRMRSPDRLSSSESPYQLSYSGEHKSPIINGNHFCVTSVL